MLHSCVERILFISILFNFAFYSFVERKNRVFSELSVILNENLLNSSHWCTVYSVHPIGSTCSLNINDFE